MLVIINNLCEEGNFPNCPNYRGDSRIFLKNCIFLCNFKNYPICTSPVVRIYFMYAKVIISLCVHLDAHIHIFVFWHIKCHSNEQNIYFGRQFLENGVANADGADRHEDEWVVKGSIAEAALPAGYGWAGK